MKVAGSHPSGFVKRLALIVLLIVLPLQTLWAAGAGHCVEHGGKSEHPPGLHDGPFSATHAHAHDGQAEEAGHATSSAVDCSAFHFVALEASWADLNALPRAGAMAFEALDRTFKSHIPKGPYRPRWRFAV